jgi:hypothetical protein
LAAGRKRMVTLSIFLMAVSTLLIDLRLIYEGIDIAVARWATIGA